MKRIVLAFLSFFICVGTSFAADVPAKAGVFRAGVAVVDVTPPKFPVRVNGMFTERTATQAVDRLHARCFALDDGSTTIVLCIVDTCMMPRDLLDRAKAFAAKETGLPAERMMISATHTHSGASAMGCLGSRADPAYADWLPGRLAEGIVEAVKALQPARVGWAAVDDFAHTHNRRWIRRADKIDKDPFGVANVRANMHPGYESPAVIGPSGPVDPGLSVLAMQTLDGRPLGLLANYSQHYFGSPLLSTDYYGVFCKHIAKQLGQASGDGPFVAAMSQGTSGDLMWMDYGTKKKDYKLDTYAAEVAAQAMEAYKKIEWTTNAPIAMVEKKSTLSYRLADPERLAWAQKAVDALKEKLPAAKPDIYAQEAIFLNEKQKAELKLQGIRIGDLTLAALPNEVYSITGLKLKAQTPGKMHFNIELANGAEGYIPPPEQHKLGGYTTWAARTAGLEVNAEPQIVETLLTALEEATGKKRAALVDENGPYAQAILDAKPTAYWRLNDIAGTQAKNAIANGPTAEITDGAGWYLPGVGSGSGCGESERLTTSAFSGPKQINRAVHLAGGHIKVDSHGLGETFSIVTWFWLGEKSGASERSGQLITLPTGDALDVRQTKEHHMQLMVSNKEASELSPAMKADEWHCVVSVCDGGTWKIFLDGNPASKYFMKPVTVKKEKSPLLFGKGLEGKLDEIAVFDRVLSKDEIELFWRISGIKK